MKPFHLLFLLCSLSPLLHAQNSTGGVFRYVGPAASFKNQPCGPADIAFATDVTAGTNLYMCPTQNAWTQMQTSAAGANAALSNLASVSINTSLIPQTGVALGTSSAPFSNLFIYGSGTFGANNFEITGSATAPRTVMLPDAASNTDQGIANPNDTNVVNYIGTDGVQHRIAQSGGSGTVNAAAQYDLPYYSVSGSNSTLSGAAIAGLVQASTSAAPRAANAHNVQAPLVCADSSGSATAQSCTTSPSYAWTTGDTILYSTTTQNSGDLTISVNTVGPTHVRKWQGNSALASGDMRAGVPTLLTYDGTYWEMYVIGNPPTSGSSTVLNNTGDSWFMGWGPDMMPGGNGNILTTVNGTGGNNATNSIEYQRVWFPGGVANNITFEVTTGGTTSSNWSWGLYCGYGSLGCTVGNTVLYTGVLCHSSGTDSTPSLASPGTLTVNSSSKDCGGVASTAIGLGTNIPQGFYWQSTTSNDGSTLAFRSLVVTSDPTVSFNTGLVRWGKLASGSTGGALPTTGATIPPTQTDSSGIPLIMVSR